MDTTAQVDLFFARKPRQWALFEALRTALCEAYPQTQLRVMKTCIALVDPKPYCYVSSPRPAMANGKPDEALLLTISLRQRMDHPRFAMVVPISARRFTVHMVISREEEIDGELLALIGLSHQG